MDSPNTGKSRVEQLICMARALTAYDPAACDENVALWRSMRKLEQENGLVYDQWIRIISDKCERYCKESRSGAGQSLSQLPEGANVAQTIDLRGQKPVTDEFAQSVEKYIGQTAFLILAEGDKGIKDAAVGYDPSTANLLRMSLAACTNSYNEDKIREFRTWLGTVTEKAQVGKFCVPIVSPDHLVSFCRHLAGLHASYAADALLFGSVATSTDVCIKVARDTSPSDEAKRHVIFMALAAYLTAGDVYHPVQILDGILTQCIKDGSVASLMEIANIYRQKVSAGILAAKSAISIDEYLAKLYNLVPYAHGAHLIYAHLVSSKSGLTPDQYKQAKGAEGDADETLVRLIGPFHYQIMDFDGQVWNDYRNKIRIIRKERGEEAVISGIADLIDRFLIYPEALRSSLLAE